MRLNKLEHWALRTMFQKSNGFTLDDFRDELKIKRYITRKYPDIDAIRLDSLITSNLIRKGYLKEKIENGQFVYHSTLKALKYCINNNISVE